MIIRISFGWYIVKKLNNIFLLYLGAAPVWPWQIQSTEQETEEQVDAHASRSADLCPQTCMMVPLWLYLSCYVELSRKRLVALWHRHIIKKKTTCTINISKTLFFFLCYSRTLSDELSVFCLFRFSQRFRRVVEMVPEKHDGLRESERSRLHPILEVRTGSVRSDPPLQT